MCGADGALMGAQQPPLEQGRDEMNARQQLVRRLGMLGEVRNPYRAANWHYLGDTQGRGHDPKHEQNKSRKAIFAYPLQADWRQCLTEGHRAVELKKRYRNDLQSSRTRSVGDAFVAMWTEVTHILPEVAAQYDEQWRVRKRVIDSLILMLLIFRLVSSKNAQSYGTTI